MQDGFEALSENLDSMQYFDLGITRVSDMSRMTMGRMQDEIKELDKEIEERHAAEVAAAEAASSHKPATPAEATVASLSAGLYSARLTADQPSDRKEPTRAQKRRELRALEQVCQASNFRNVHPGPYSTQHQPGKAHTCHCALKFSELHGATASDLSCGNSSTSIKWQPTVGGRVRLRRLQDVEQNASRM